MIHRVRVRAAHLGDILQVVEYNRRLAWETEGKVLNLPRLAAGVEGLFADPARGRYYVAELQGQGTIVGQVMLTFEWSDWRNGNFWWLQSVYVEESYRRLGVFRKLLEHVRGEAARTPRVVGLRLYVENANERAMAAYRSLGFVDAHYRVLECLNPPEEID